MPRFAANLTMTFNEVPSRSELGPSYAAADPVYAD
jgi:hydroxypyruvate isomerase